MFCGNVIDCFRENSQSNVPSSSPSAPTTSVASSTSLSSWSSTQNRNAILVSHRQVVLLFFGVFHMVFVLSHDNCIWRFSIYFWYLPCYKRGISNSKWLLARSRNDYIIFSSLLYAERKSFAQTYQECEMGFCRCCLWLLTWAKLLCSLSKVRYSMV